MYVGKPAAEDP